MTEKKKTETETPKVVDKVAELARTVASTKGKFLRHLQSKNPDLDKLALFIDQHEAAVKECYEAALDENLRMTGALERLQEVETQKQILLKDLQGAIPETGDPIKDAEE